MWIYDIGIIIYYKPDSKQNCEAFSLIHPSSGMFNFIGRSSFSPKFANAGFILSCPVNPDLKYLEKVSSTP